MTSPALDQARHPELLPLATRSEQRAADSSGAVEGVERSKQRAGRVSRAKTADPHGPVEGALRPAGPVRRLLAGLACGLLTFLGLLLAAATLPVVVGWHPVVITSGSMQPGIAPGDVVLARPVGAQQVEPGRAVVVVDPARPGRLLTHRLVRRTSDGSLILRGDANAAPDSTPVPSENVRGEVVAVIPAVGRPLLWWQQRDVAALLSGAVLLFGVVALARPSHAQVDAGTDGGTPGPMPAKPRDRDLPSPVARSSQKAQDTFAETRASAEKTYDGDAGRAARVAYSALKHSFEKVGDHWEEKEQRGPSDAQAERSGAAALAGDRPTAGGVDANASKKHLYGLAQRLEIAGRSRMSKAELVEAIDKENRKATAAARA